jgi:hypothetical protein
MMDKDKLIDALRQLAKRLNTENISKSMMDADRDTPCSSSYKRVFGSWGNAISLAGLKTGKITGRPWDPPIFVSDRAVEIIEGELLGDGSLEATPTSGNSGFVHSTANFHYSIYLEQALLKSDISVSSETLPPRKINGKMQRRIRTPSNQSFRQMLLDWYPLGIKIVPEKLILTKTKCLHWYLGDGYVGGKNSRFSTCGFTWGEVHRLAEMLGKLGFKTSVDRHSGGYPVLRLLTAASRDFLDWIGPCPVIGYEHRWNLKGK